MDARLFELHAGGRAVDDHAHVAAGGKAHQVTDALFDFGPRAGTAEVEPDSLLPLLAAASIQGRVALGPDAGQRIERAGGEPLGADRFDAGAGSLCAHQDGFSLHTEVHVKAHDRTRLEHLCRYVARGPIVSERLSLSSEGEVIYELRRAWRDGTTHIVFDPLTFIERLAARVPRPRVHLVTYHGVLAPASSWRDMIVPSPPPLFDEPGTAPDEPRGRSHVVSKESSPNTHAPTTAAAGNAPSGPFIGTDCEPASAPESATQGIWLASLLALLDTRA